MEKYDGKDDLYEEIGICNNRCKKCIHSSLLNCSCPSCDYILNTGHRRPCPAGKNCTVFEPRKSRKVKRLAEIPKYEKKCALCGTTFIGNSYKKYCATCSEIRAHQSNRFYRAKEREIRQKAEMAIPKFCTVCGCEFHSTSNLNTRCQAHRNVRVDFRRTKKA